MKEKRNDCFEDGAKKDILRRDHFTNNVNIKKAEFGDLNTIEVIYNESIDWLNNQNIHQWKRDVYPKKETAKDALREGSLYCCYDDKKITGTFVINEFQPVGYGDLNWKYNYDKVLVLHTLVVKPGEVGKGIGRAIVEFVISYAGEQKYNCIRIDVFPDNKAAVKLYLSYGFEYVGKVFFEIKEPGYEWYDCYEKLV